MSGGAAKRAKRGEKATAAEAVTFAEAFAEADLDALSSLKQAANAAVDALITGDAKAYHEAQNLLPQRLQNVASSGQSVVAPPLAQVGEKRSLEPDYVNFDYDIEQKKLEIREKNLALFKQEQQAKLDFDVKQQELDIKRKDAEVEVYIKKKKVDCVYRS